MSMLRVRGFEVISDYDKLPPEERPILPRRQTKYSAGYDFYAVGDVLIPKGWAGMIHTGVKAYMLPDEHLEVHIRSSYGMRYGLRMANGTGIIDADYYNNPDNEGHIMLAVINTGVQPLVLKKGERVAQGIFYKYLTTDDDALSEKEDRSGGFGSTETEK